MSTQSDTKDDKKAGDDDDGQKDDNSSAEDSNTKEHNETTGVDNRRNDQLVSSLQTEMDEKYGVRHDGRESQTIGSNRRPSHSKQDIKLPNLQVTSLTQYSIKKGLKFW